MSGEPAQDADLKRCPAHPAAAPFNATHRCPWCEIDRLNAEIHELDAQRQHDETLLVALNDGNARYRQEAEHQRQQAHLWAGRGAEDAAQRDEARAEVERHRQAGTEAAAKHLDELAKVKRAHEETYAHLGYLVHHISEAVGVKPGSLDAAALVAKVKAARRGAL